MLRKSAHTVVKKITATKETIEYVLNRILRPHYLKFSMVNFDSYVNSTVHAI